MADNHSKEVISMNLSHIRGTNFKPEEIVRKYLFAKGLRYRNNVKNLLGKLDIVLPKYKTVDFLNGCFGIISTVDDSCDLRQMKNTGIKRLTGMLNEVRRTTRLLKM